MTSKEGRQATARLQQLTELYHEIWQWGTRYYDPLLVEHRIDAIDPDARLFIVAEAHAQDQVRLTGINWFDQHGDLGPSGQRLDELLRCIGYTVFPPSTVKLGNAVVRGKDADLHTVYTTEIFPSYPPGGGAPTLTMLRDAHQRGFLVRELEIIQPKAILLLGAHSYKTFYDLILERAVTNGIKDAFGSLSPANSLDQYMGIPLIPFMHPSPANAHFLKWFRAARPTLCDQPQVRAIVSAIDR